MCSIVFTSVLVANLQTKCDHTYCPAKNKKTIYNTYRGDNTCTVYIIISDSISSSSKVLTTYQQHM